MGTELYPDNRFALGPFDDAMNTTGISNLASETEELKDVLIARQEQMANLNDARFHALEGQIREKDGIVRDTERKYRLLKKDFAYNLSLLEGRDEELKRYDDTFRSLKKVILDKAKLIQDMKTTVSDLNARVKREQQRSNDVETYYQEKLQEVKAEHEATLASAKEDAKMRETESERIIRGLRQQSSSAGETAEAVRRSLEERLSQTLASCKEDLDRATGRLHEADVRTKQLETQLAHSNGQRDADRRRNETQVSALQAQLRESKEAMTRELDRVRLEANESIRDREGQIREAMTSRLQGSQDEVERLRAKVKAANDAVDELKLAQQAELDAKNEEMKGIRNEVELQFYHKDKKAEGLGQRVYALEAELDTLRETTESLRRSLDEKQAEAETLRLHLQRQRESGAALQKELLRSQLVQERETDVAGLKKNQASLQARLEAKEREADMLRSEVRQAKRIRRREAIANDIRTELRDVSDNQGVADASTLFSGNSSILAHQRQDREQVERTRALEEQVRRLKTDLQSAKQAEKDARSSATLLQSQLDLTAVSPLRDPAVVTTDRLQAVVSDLRSEFSPHSQVLTSMQRTSPLGIDGAEQLTHLNSLLTDLRVECEREKDKVKSAEESAFATKRENTQLKRRLGDAARDVKRMLRQREKLVHLNNLYKSELSVHRQKVAQDGSASMSELRTASATVREQTAEMSRLSSMVKDLSTSNAELQKQLLSQMSEARLPRSEEAKLRSARRRAAIIKAKRKALLQQRLIARRQKGHSFALAEGVPRFQLKKWNSVAIWVYPGRCTTCSICRNPLVEHCIDCEANMFSQESDQQECGVAWGVCNHVFHMHCISRWVQRGHHSCPLCMADWELQRYDGKSTGAM